jgi:hypothetical protein
MIIRRVAAVPDYPEIYSAFSNKFAAANPPATG